MKKKLLSIVLAAAMVLSMSATVFAGETGDEDALGSETTEEGTTDEDAGEEEESSSTASSTNGWVSGDMSEVHILKTYKLVGSGSSPEETFTVTQQSKAVTDGEASEAPDLGTITGASYVVGEATEAGVVKEIVVELPTYSYVGVYTYTLTETDNKVAGVSYADNTITLVVTVINDTNGNIRVGAVHTETITEDEDGNVISTKTDGITNTYTANSLSIQKIVDGNLGDKTKEFTFTVTFTAPDGKKWENAITTSGGATGLTQSGNTYTFTLSNGDTETFANIPEGVTYTISETAVEGYSTTKTLNGTEVTTDNVSGTMDSTADAVVYTNTKTGDVDTGVILDSAPYIMILALVLLGAAYVISRRRLSDRY